MASSMKKKFGRKSSSISNRDDSNSRAVLNKAMLYSLAYLLSWSWFVIYFFVSPSSGTSGTVPPLLLSYMMAIFNPFEGLSNFLIYLHPTVGVHQKSPRGRHLLAPGIWESILGRFDWWPQVGQNSPARNRGRDNVPAVFGDARGTAPAALAAGGNDQESAATTPTALGETNANASLAYPGGTAGNGSQPSNDYHRPSNDDEEEEMKKIEAPNYLEENWPTSSDAPETMAISENVCTCLHSTTVVY